MTLRLVPAIVLASLAFGSTAHAGVTFRPAPGSPVATGGTYPFSVAAGDVNGDGKADLVVPNWTSNNLGILLGDGAGNFAAMGSTPLATVGGPRDVAIADIDRDGDADLIVGGNTNTTPGGINVFVGSGPGGFAQLAGSPFASPTATGVATGDLNGDGYPDIVAVDGGISVMLSTGSAAWAAPVAYGLGTNSNNVSVGDLNGDGHPDIASTDRNANKVGVLINKGNGTFAANATLITVGTSPESVTIGDLNGDGFADLLVADSGQPSILYGNGTGGFSSRVSLSIGGTPSFAMPADFNGDHHLDIASQSASLNILTGVGGVFSPIAGSPFTVGAAPLHLAVADFNGDGALDIASLSEDSPAGHVVVLLNTPIATATDIGFGDVVTGQQSPTLFARVTNEGAAPLSIASAVLGGANMADFAIQSDACTGVKLTPGGWCLLGVRLTPGANGARAATILVTDNASPTTQTIILGGYGRAPNTGPTGPAGVIGSAGQTGPPGAQGPVGAAGPAGVNGQPGQAGATGADAVVVCRPLPEATKKKRAKQTLVCTLKAVATIRGTARVQLTRSGRRYAATRARLHAGRATLRVPLRGVPAGLYRLDVVLPARGSLGAVTLRVRVR
jgi:hypothetical protein